MGLSELPQVVPFAAAHVQHPPGRAEKLADRRGYGRVEPRAEKPPPGADLLRRVAGMQGVLLLHGQKVDITLPRHIKAVPLRAAPDRFPGHDGHIAYGTAQCHGTDSFRKKSKTGAYYRRRDAG